MRVAAERGGVREQLLYGVGLQRVGRPVSAARVFDQASRRYPGEVEAQVAGAVGAFDKDAPEKAFGRLGPLTREYGDEPSVRFHLGVLLLWTGRIDAAKRQFRLAARAEPGSPLAREATRYLETIRRAAGETRDRLARLVSRSSPVRRERVGRPATPKHLESVPAELPLRTRTERFESAAPPPPPL